MSYCRFSSDDFQCDVYCYADVSGGYTTHVAARRHVLSEPVPARVSDMGSPEWLERHRKMSKLLDSAEIVPIGLPHDGAYFNDATAAEAAARLESLRSEGYIVPQYAIDALMAKEEA